MSVNLQYNYAVVDVNDGFCYACITTSDEINVEGYILVPELGDYVDKYYNFSNGKWYYDASYTQEATELNG